MASSFSSLTAIFSSTSTCLHRCHHSTTRIYSYSPPRPPLRRRAWCRISIVSRHPIADSNRYWNGKMYHASLHMASLGRNLAANVERKREVVEHIYLLKAREDLSNEEEKNMLDHLYTTQYHMSGIVAISLGRTSGQNPQNYTHAVYMRFHGKQDLTRFYENPSYLQILKEHVMPHCHESKYVDFESEVMDDILSVFRKGEDFNYGVEFVLLIAFHASAFGATAEGALASLEKLATEFPNLIVQITQGSNFNPGSAEFTHGIVIRFRSTEALQLFLDSSEYKEVSDETESACEMAPTVSFMGL